MRSHRLIAALIACYITLIAKAQSGTVFRLLSGYNIPIVGFGTHGLDGEELEKVLYSALEKGLRHIDTGFVYQNEETIGKVLKNWFNNGGKREDIFITSKLPYFDNRPESVQKYLNLSLEKLGLEYVDLYLIHAPFGVLRKNNSYDVDINEDGTVKLDFETDYIATWKEMEKQVMNKRTKSIGLSNFNQSQISDILKVAKIKPSNLQIEIHAYHQQKLLREFCQQHGIIVTGYAPLGSGGARAGLRPEQKLENFPNLMKLPVLTKIAKKYGKSAVQILLRHSIQGGIVVIPGSKKPDHLKSNLEIFDFELSEEEMANLNSLDRGEDGKVFNYKLILKGIEKHPFYPFIGSQ